MKFYIKKYGAGLTLLVLMFTISSCKKYLDEKDKSNYQKQMSFWQTLLRSIYLIPVFPFVLLLLIDPVYMFFNPENQRLSERMSKTRVVERYRMLD